MHDELLVAVLKTAYLLQEAQDIADLTRAGMQEVVPDIRIGVETQIISRWSKDALVDLDERGYLRVDSGRELSLSAA